MRVFVAVFPPPAVQSAAHAMGQALRRPGDLVSWVKPENLHYTLRFIGEVGDDGARRVGEAAQEAAAKAKPFEAALGGLGAFPNARKARVLWVGLSAGVEPLEALARDLESAIRKRGFDRADKPFSAHLTLGRPRETQDWTERLAAARPPQPPPAFAVDRLSVMISRLSPKGSTYTVHTDAMLGTP